MTDSLIQKIESLIYDGMPSEQIAVIDKCCSVVRQHTVAPDFDKWYEEQSWCCNCHTDIKNVWQAATAAMKFSDCQPRNGESGANASKGVTAGETANTSEISATHMPEELREPFEDYYCGTLGLDRKAAQWGFECGVMHGKCQSPEPVSVSRLHSVWEMAYGSAHARNENVNGCERFALRAVLQAAGVSNVD